MSILRERRKNIWKKYNEAFEDLPCITPVEPEPNTRHAYYLYTPLIDIDKLGKSRDWVLTSMIVMKERGIKDALTEDEHFIQVGIGFRRLP